MPVLTDGFRVAAGSRPARCSGTNERRTGLGSAFSVVRQGGTYVLFAVAAGTAATVVPYRACSLTGPWHGPARVLALRCRRAGHRVRPAGASGTRRGRRLVLGHDVDWLRTTDASAQLSGGAVYRPRLVNLRLRPGR
ncbi:hypothetical protein [Streptomyces glaucescens]|uniref:hypothetical protein n=1 Tax=Streptomyces glaucescens TaxID=1907 RepID=UPI000A36D112|nr:hypothetical protein [Streptomyces glaucescens]